MVPKRRKFVQEYLLDFNATQAAIRAGYSKNGAGQTGHDLLKNPEVKAAIEEGMKQDFGRYEVTEQRIIAELAKLAFSNMEDYMKIGPDGDPVLDWSALDRDQKAAIVEVTVEDFKDARGTTVLPDGTVEKGRDVRRVKFKLADKKGAIVDLGKHLGMFKDRVDLNVKRELSELDDADLAAIAALGAKGAGGAADTGRENELDQLH